MLLYLALRDVDFDAMWDALRRADWRWLVPMVAVALLSHLVRAWRWTLLLEAIVPPAEARGDGEDAPAAGEPLRVPGLGLAFASVMIGYMVNYAAPRLGEVARTANLSRRARLPFPGVFGTVVVERILDVVMLGGLLVATGVLLMDRSDEVNALFVEPVASRLAALPVGLLVVGVLTAAAAGGAIVVWGLRAEAGRAVRARLLPLALSFRDGLASVLRAPRRGALVGSTLVIWALYVGLAHLPFLLLGLAGPYELSLADSVCIMTLGAVGVVVPTPGGAGPFHWITVLALTRLYGLPEASAAAYAVLAHGAQLVLYTLVGGLCLVLQGSGLRALRTPPPTPSGEATRDVPAAADRP